MNKWLLINHTLPHSLNFSFCFYFLWFQSFLNSFSVNSSAIQNSIFCLLFLPFVTSIGIKIFLLQGINLVELEHGHMAWTPNPVSTLVLGSLLSRKDGHLMPQQKRMMAKSALDHVEGSKLGKMKKTLGLFTMVRSHLQSRKWNFFHFRLAAFLYP